MNVLKTTLLAALVGASTMALADVPVTNTTRDQRMDQALQDYRNGSTSSSSSTAAPKEGRWQQTKERFKSDAHNAGQEIKQTSKDAGHAVANGARKTGHAIHKGADKAVDKVKGNDSK
jgi:hypothetical protein